MDSQPPRTATPSWWSEQSSSFVSYRGSCAFGGKAAKKVSNGDGSQASIFLFSSVEASTAEERGNYGGNLASHHGVHELGEGDCCRVSPGVRGLKHNSEVLWAET